MGLFSTKTEHTVNTTVTRLVEDADIHKSMNSSVISSLLRNDGQIIENIIEGLVSGVGMRAHRMYDYAGKTYSFGRPSIQNRASNDGSTIAETIIKDLVGLTATIDYCEYAPFNNMHYGWTKLVDDYGYKSSTNQLDVLSTAKGTPVYLKDMRVVLTQATMDKLSEDGLGQWGIPPNAGVTPTRPVMGLENQVTPTLVLVDPDAVADSVLVTYQWVVSTPTYIDGVSVNTDVVHEESISIALPVVPDEDDYFQVKYFYNGDAGYWSYKDGLGTYPDLEAVYHTEMAAFGSFFPFAYIRYNNTSAAADITTTEYKTSKKLLSYIGIDYADLIASVHENPDVDYLEQAILMMAVPATSINEVEQRYLFDFFNKLYLNSGNTSISNIDTKSSGNLFTRLSTPKFPRLNWVIQDARFKMTIGCNNIYRRKKAGVIGAVGAYTNLYELHAVEVEHGQRDAVTGNETRRTKTSYVPTHFYRHQISDSVYEEIEVVRMSSRYYIWGGMYTVGDETDPILLIPLDYSVTENYTLSVKEELYTRSLHLVFNSHVITKIKWYQTGFFKFLILVIAIAVMVYTQGASWEATMAALAAMSAEALTAFVLMAVLKYVIVTLAVKLFVKLVGPEIAFVVAIVLAVMGMYQGFEFGSLEGAPWANELLSLSTSLAAGVGNFIQAGMAQLQNEYLLFADYVKEQLELLEKAQDLLETSNILSPFVIFGESPDDYYNRTVHSGNIGIVGIDAIHYYVDTALQLPELKDTMRYN